MELHDMVQKIFNTAEEHGFHRHAFNFGERLMLVVSELGEALEAHRSGHWADIHDVASLLKKFDAFDFEHLVKDTVEDELADSVIRIFDLCAEKGIDIESHIKLKMQYNVGRPFKHGKEY